MILKNLHDATNRTLAAALKQAGILHDNKLVVAAARIPMEPEYRA